MPIRILQKNDLPKLSALIKRNIEQMHKQHYSKRELVIWIDAYTVPMLESHLNKGNKIWVFEEDQQLKGGIQLAKNELKGLFIAPSCLGQGIGAALTKTVLNYAKLQGEKKVVLSSNKWAYNFYLRQGFQDKGMISSYWEELLFEEHYMCYPLED